MEPGYQAVLAAVTDTSSGAKVSQRLSSGNIVL